MTKQAETVKYLETKGYHVVIKEHDNVCMTNKANQPAEVLNNGRIYLPEPIHQTVEEAMDLYGFHPYHTGGGCMAFMKEYPATKTYRLITDHIDPIMPTKFRQKVCIGEYHLETGNATGDEFADSVITLLIDILDNHDI